MSPATGRAMTWVVGAVGAVAVVFGLLSIESPSDARIRRLDERRVDDLQRLSAAIDLYRLRTGRLPETAAELDGVDAGAVASRDPESAAPYEYAALGDGDRYELCAVFRRPSTVPAPAGFWTHGAGRMCFQITPRPIVR